MAIRYNGIEKAKGIRAYLIKKLVKISIEYIGS
jgi:hypothetical protein